MTSGVAFGFASVVFFLCLLASGRLLFRAWPLLRVSAQSGDENDDFAVECFLSLLDQAKRSIDVYAGGRNPDEAPYVRNQLLEVVERKRSASPSFKVRYVLHHEDDKLSVTRILGPGVVSHNHGAYSGALHYKVVIDGGRKSYLSWHVGYKRRFRIFDCSYVPDYALGHVTNILLGGYKPDGPSLKWWQRWPREALPGGREAWVAVRALLSSAPAAVRSLAGVASVVALLLGSLLVIEVIREPLQDDVRTVLAKEGKNNDVYAVVVEELADGQIIDLIRPVATKKQEAHRRAADTRVNRSIDDWTAARSQDNVLAAGYSRHLPLNQVYDSAGTLLDGKLTTQSTQRAPWRGLFGEYSGTAKAREAAALAAVHPEWFANPGGRQLVGASTLAPFLELTTRRDGSGVPQSVTRRPDKDARRELLERVIGEVDGLVTGDGSAKNKAAPGMG
jgi:hypothetical protein